LVSASVIFALPGPHSHGAQRSLKSFTHLHPESTQPLGFRGNVGYQINNGLLMSADTVANQSASPSGNIRLELWASPTAYSGGTLTGYVLGTANLAPLAAGSSYGQITEGVNFASPPSGQYHVALTLEQYDATQSTWFIVDFFQFANTQSFLAFPVSDQGNTSESTNSSTTIGVSTSTATFGTAVTFTATVTASVSSGDGAPSGTVTFSDGSTFSASVSLDGNGVATYSNSALSVGTHSVTATYTGNVSLAASTSNPVTITIASAAGAQATLTASPNPLPAGVDVTTLTWNAPGTSNVQVHVGSASGTLFAGGGSTGSATTGPWAGAGQIFYLVDAPTQAVLAQLTLQGNGSTVGGSATLAANPSSLPPGINVTTLTWNAPGSTAVQVRVNSASGPLFAEGGSTGSATTGPWANVGLAFYLMDGSTQAVLAHVTLQAGTAVTGGSATLTASPISLSPGVDVTTLSWDAPSSSLVQIRIGSAEGTLFAEGGQTGSATTGAWASNGMTFYLVDARTQAVLSQVTLGASASLTANPSTLPPGGGTTTLAWNAPGVSAVKIYVGSASGTLFAEGGQPALRRPAHGLRPA
jgi:Bacterial Ig-like domain (group 3)